MNHSDYLAALERLQMLNNPSVDQRVKAIYCHADAVLADKATIYDAEHDPTPLTVVLAEGEIGERSRDSHAGCWHIGCVSLWVYDDHEIWIGDELVRENATIGHLRQIVAMLRGGGA